MKYTKKILRSKTLQTIKNEFLFEIASERFSGTELIRFELENAPEGGAMEKLSLAITRFMRSLKLKGLVQVYATQGSFKINNTEAKYLINKFPEVFSEEGSTESEGYFIYVKP